MMLEPYWVCFGISTDPMNRFKLMLTDLQSLMTKQHMDPIIQQLFCDRFFFRHSKKQAQKTAVQKVYPITKYSTAPSLIASNNTDNLNMDNQKHQPERHPIHYRWLFGPHFYYHNILLIYHL